MSSFRLKIDPRARAVGRFILSVRMALQQAFAEEKADNDLTRAELARKLGTHRSAITRWLSGSDSLSLRTIAELAWAMGREVEVVFRKKADRPGANEVRVSEHPPVQATASSAEISGNSSKPFVQVIAG